MRQKLQCPLCRQDFRVALFLKLKTEGIVCQLETSEEVHSEDHEIQLETVAQHQDLNEDQINHPPAVEMQQDLNLDGIEGHPNTENESLLDNPNDARELQNGIEL